MEKNIKLETRAGNLVVGHSPECPMLQDLLANIQKKPACFVNGLKNGMIQRIQSCPYYNPKSLKGADGEYVFKCKRP